MNQIDESINQLITAILESEEYQQYLKIREKVKQDPEKEKAIHDYRMRNYQMHKNRNVDLFDEFDRIEHEFESFRAEPLVDDYLAAELAVCRLFQKINWSMLERVEFDLVFFDQ